MPIKPSNDWTDDDIATSAKQGWQLVYVWSDKHQRLEYEMRTVKNDLRIDCVAGKTAPNKLTARALSLIFNSKLGSLRPDRRKK